MIYYLFTYNEQLLGVNAKIFSKIKALNELGVSVRGIMLYTNERLDLSKFSDDLIDFYYFNPPKNTSRVLNSRPFGWVNSYWTKRKGTKALYNNVLKNKEIDLLVTRYGTSDFSTLWLVRKLNGKVLYESNTNEIEQLKLRFKGFFKSPLWVSYDYYSEKIFGPKVLRKVKGLICVTNEIATYQRERIGKNSRTNISVVSNGINVDTYPMPSSLKNDTINLIMVLGVDSPWNGLDIIANAILSSSLNAKLFVVGEVSQVYKSPNIIYTGKLDKKEVDSLIDTNGIVCGVGTLALSRKGITEACPLKVREYLSRGLPVVYNYFDTDIDADETFRDEFCIKLKNEPSTIDLDKIIVKLKKIQSIEGYQNEIKAFALKNIDMKVKMSLYKRCILEILAK